MVAEFKNKSRISSPKHFFTKHVILGGQKGGRRRISPIRIVSAGHSEEVWHLTCHNFQHEKAIKSCWTCQKKIWKWSLNNSCNPKPCIRIRYLIRTQNATRFYGKKHEDGLKRVFGGSFNPTCQAMEQCQLSGRNKHHLHARRRPLPHLQGCPKVALQECQFLAKKTFGHQARQISIHSIFLFGRMFKQSLVTYQHLNLDHLKATVTDVCNNLSVTYIWNICKRFRLRVECVVAAEGGYIDK